MVKPIDRTTVYALRVVEGKIKMGKDVTASCQRHLNDLKRKDIYFDVMAAERVFRFFENILKLNGGQFEGKPFLLHESQAFILGSIFGWRRRGANPDRSEDYRRFRRAYIEIGKGNGKSPLVAGIGLYGMIADGEARAEIYSAASNLDQAKILHRDAIAMVQQSPSLNGACSITGGDHQPNIAHLETASFFRPISSEQGKGGRGGKSGPRPHFALCDEVHEHKNRNTIDMLERGFKFRRQPLLVMITNSGFDKQTVCWEEHNHAVKVAHGEIKDDTTFSYVCGMDMKKTDDGKEEYEDPLEDESLWIKANPLLGTILTHEYLAGNAAQAKAMPGKRNGILRLHFCQWTEAESVWMPRELWEACEWDGLEPDPAMPCYGALDLSMRRDLTAGAWVWKYPDGTYDAIVDFWTPGDSLKAREDKDRVTYLQWKRDGYINALPGKTVNYAHVVPRIAHMDGVFDLQKIAYDRWRVDLLERAMEEGGVNVEMEKFGQGWKDMGPAIEIAEEIIMAGRLRVLYNPCLRWNIASTVVVEDETGARKFAKNKSTGRIDGAVALVMALAIAEKNQETDISAILNDPIIGKWNK